MATHLIVKWEVDDGYAGHSRPQETRIPLDEFEGMNEEEREEYIDNCIFEDFVNLGWSIISEEEE